jgi:hypothetical protein
MSDAIDAAQAIAEGTATGTPSNGPTPPAATTPPPPATEPGTEAPSGPTSENPPGSASEVAKLRQESAGYRTKLRAREAENERLAARVDTQDRTAVEAVAAGVLRDASDLWLADVELTRVRDERTGELDAAKVQAEIKRVATERPHWTKDAPDFAQGAKGPPAERVGFGATLKQAVGRR